MGGEEKNGKKETPTTKRNGEKKQKTAGTTKQASYDQGKQGAGRTRQRQTMLSVEKETTSGNFQQCCATDSSGTCRLSRRRSRTPAPRLTF